MNAIPIRPKNHYQPEELSLNGLISELTRIAGTPQTTCFDWDTSMYGGALIEELLNFRGKDGAAAFDDACHTLIEQASSAKNGWVLMAILLQNPSRELRDHVSDILVDCILAHPDQISSQQYFRFIPPEASKNLQMPPGHLLPSQQQEFVQDYLIDAFDHCNEMSGASIARLMHRHQHFCRKHLLPDQWDEQQDFLRKVAWTTDTPRRCLATVDWALAEPGAEYFSATQWQNMELQDARAHMEKEETSKAYDRYNSALSKDLRTKGEASGLDMPAQSKQLLDDIHEDIRDGIGHAILDGTYPQHASSEQAAEDKKWQKMLQDKMQKKGGIHFNKK